MTRLATEQRATHLGISACKVQRLAAAVLDQHETAALHFICGRISASAVA